MKKYTMFSKIIFVKISDKFKNVLPVIISDVAVDSVGSVSLIEAAHSNKLYNVNHYKSNISQDKVGINVVTSLLISYLNLKEGQELYLLA